MSGRRGLGRTTEDTARELRFHIAMKTDELIAGGMDPESARREAERRFGDVRRVSDECAAIDERHRRIERVRSLFTGLARDFRVAARMRWWR